MNTPKVVSGIDAESLAAVRAFYETLVDEVIPVSGTREAELTKLLENTFRHVNIALVNELAMFAGNLGIDIWEAIDAASTKPFGYMRFTPGPGVGGHCLPIDPSYLSWRVKSSLGQSFRFVELANDINDHMPDYVVRRLQEALNERRQAVNGSRILLLGLTYKKNTSDARESPGIHVARRLVAMGADRARRRSARARDAAAPRRARRSHGEGARRIRRRRPARGPRRLRLRDAGAARADSFSTLAPVSTVPRSSACSSRRLTARAPAVHPIRFEEARHSMSQTYLITGGAGFIGSHLSERLLERGDSVVVLDDVSTGRLENLVGFRDHPRFSLEIGSVLDELKVDSWCTAATSSCTSRPRSG